MGWLKDRKDKKMLDMLDSEEREYLLMEAERIKATGEHRKAHPEQENIKQESGTVAVETNNNILSLYLNHESCNRGVNMLVDALASIDIDIKPPSVADDPEEIIQLRPISVGVNSDIQGDNLGTRKKSVKSLSKLLNYQPNPYQDKYSVMSAFWLDFFLYGNAFLYYDKTGLYHLRASLMEVVPGTKRHIDHFIYNGEVGRKMLPANVIHIKDNDYSNNYVGRSRLTGSITTGAIMDKMSGFQFKFFENGAIMGLVLQSDNVLSPKVKAKILRNWAIRYSATDGGRRPAILDGGIKSTTVGLSTYKDLDFDVGYTSREVRVLKSLGVPPILLDSGNNANLRPNMKLFYELAVLPAFERLLKYLEVYFGHDFEPVLQKIPALQPEAADIAKSATTLVNGGLITPNEGRAALRLPKLTGKENDELRIPQNIAGSAVNPDTGGKPPADETEDGDKK